MKNFRKVLALILVVATLFSFVAMTSAKEYTDADKISYDEAVDVLSAIGILNGYNDGSFKPTDSIAREEMAKMVAVLSNAGDDISSLYANACKFADTKDRWSASYVAYCNETGIVAGRNASTFDPRGKVTGIETAKMLLCLLGFDATTQGYVGTNWKTNVLRDAKDFGLLNDFAADYDIAKAITREEAAQMMLNALKANIVVGTISGNLVKITNTLYVDDFGNLKVSIADASKYGWVVLTRQNVVISNTPLASIYKGLEVNPGLDCYGNPGYKWTYTNAKGTVVFEKFYVAAADYTYTKAATLVSDLSEEIKSTKDYKYVVFEDGARRVTKTDLTAANLQNVANTYTGNGVETKVYVNDLYNLVIITVKNTYIGRVAATSNMQTKFVLEDAAYGTATAFDNTDYGFKTGDVVLYWICSNNTGYSVTVDADHETYTVNFENSATNQLHAAKLATPVTGTVSAVSYDKTDADNYAASSTTVGGKTYSYAANFGNAFEFNHNVMLQAQVDSSKNLGTTYDVYLDEFGYVMGWRVTPDSTVYNYGYFVEGSNKAAEGGLNAAGQHTYTYTATYYDMAGVKHEGVEIDANTYWAMTYYAPVNGRDAGMLASFVVNDDVVSIKDDPNTETHDMSANFSARIDEIGAIATTAGSDYYLGKDGSIKQDVNRDGLTSNDVTYMSGTNKTQYLVRTWDYEKEEPVYTAYTKTTLPADLFTTVLGDGQTYKMQYFWENLGGNVNLLTHVFIDASYERTAQRAFVLNYINTVSAGKFVNQIGTYDAYNAIVNGEPAILALTQQPVNDVTAGVNGAAVNRDEIFYLINANLKVIGLDADGVPVYALTNNIAPTVVAGEQLFYYEGNLVYTEPLQGSSVIAVNTAEDCLLVVGKVTVNAQGQVSVKDAVVEDSVANLGKYLMEELGVPQQDVWYYILENAWVVTSNGVATEVYVNLDAAQGVGVDGGSH